MVVIVEVCLVIHSFLKLLVVTVVEDKDDERLPNPSRCFQADLIFLGSVLEAPFDSHGCLVVEVWYDSTDSKSCTTSLILGRFDGSACQHLLNNFRSLGEAILDSGGRRPFCTAVWNLEGYCIKAE